MATRTKVSSFRDRVKDVREFALTELEDLVALQRDLKEKINNKIISSDRPFMTTPDNALKFKNMAEFLEVIDRVYSETEG